MYGFLNLLVISPPPTPPSNSYLINFFQHPSKEAFEESSTTGGEVSPPHGEVDCRTSHYQPKPLIIWAYTSKLHGVREVKYCIWWTQAGVSSP